MLKCELLYRCVPGRVPTPLTQTPAHRTGLDASDLENVSTDSDVDDGEVDPDSNDEGFYANDYPDEEDMGGLSENISSDPESDSADEDSDWER